MSEPLAVAEGERLSGTIGIEVILRTTDGGAHEVLVQPFADEQDQLRLRNELGYAGVIDIRETTYEPDAPGQRSLFAVLDFGTSADLTESATGNFLVLGSYSTMAAAQAKSDGMPAGFTTRVMRFSNDGRDLYRVLAGPVAAPDEDYERSRLLDAGYETWVLRDISYEVPVSQTRAPETPVVSDPDSAAPATPAPSVVPQRERPIAVPGANDSYNPARLNSGGYRFEPPSR